MDSQANLALPLESLVVVSGANGFIGSHVVDQLLQASFHVRGTVRDAKKSAWLEDFFAERYGKGKFELVEVPDMAASGAFDDIVKGAGGFIHVATPVMQFYDPNFAVPMVVNGVLNALKSAAKETSIKRFVLTSSSTAATDPIPNKVFEIDETTWNGEALEKAWAPPPYERVPRKLAVYSATKIEGERAAWKWYRETKPGFVLNTVLPNANIGKVLSPEHQGTPSTVGWIKALWNGFPEGTEDLKENPPQYYVNVQDNARIHVGALMLPSVKDTRLFAFAYPFNWNTILAILRELYPDRSFMDDLPGLGQDLSKVANAKAKEILVHFGRPSWASLKDSVADATKGWA